MENIKLPDDPEKPLTWGAFFEYVSNHNNTHEELREILDKFNEQLDSTQSGFNQTFNMVTSAQNTLKNDISGLKNTMGEVNSQLDESLPILKLATELIQSQLKSTNTRVIDSTKPLKERFGDWLKSYWPVVAGVATTISVLLSGLWVIVNWSLRTGLSHYEQDNIKNQKQVLSIFKEYKSKIDSSNMMISANIESNRRKLKSQAEISNIINLKINTIHGLKEK